MSQRVKAPDRQELKLSEAAETLLDECRMVLPGIQALFGFQLVAVFNQRFAQDLAKPEQVLHLVAIGLVAVAVALVMTPAAYHRHHGAREVTETFIYVSSLLLLMSMVPLAAGLSLDFYLIAHLILGDGPAAALIALAIFALMLACWFVFPRIHGLHRRISEVRHPVRSPD